MDKNEIYKTLLPELKRIAYWCEHSNEDENFDIDNLYYNLFEKFSITQDYGFLYPISVLIDTLCDSIRHNQVFIQNGYTTNIGINDLKLIINYIENNNVDLMEQDYNLKMRIIKLY